MKVEKNSTKIIKFNKSFNFNFILMLKKIAYYGGKIDK